MPGEVALEGAFRVAPRTRTSRTDHYHAPMNRALIAELRQRSDAPHILVDPDQLVAYGYDATMGYRGSPGSVVMAETEGHIVDALAAAVAPLHLDSGGNDISCERGVATDAAARAGTTFSRAEGWG